MQCARIFRYVVEKRHGSSLGIFSLTFWYSKLLKTCFRNIYSRCVHYTYRNGASPKSDYMQLQISENPFNYCYNVVLTKYLTYKNITVKLLSIRQVYEILSKAAFLDSLMNTPDIEKFGFFKKYRHRKRTNPCSTSRQGKQLAS